ncbi:hypothetical protein F0919_16375 [Taibaiella lutea]|uniref:UspA domain-containing protein n=1 Tax=Taibaiella lutea TaxID=2608001 RepID=A0A5M6CB59_9BACT|nr:hypothetical protein [Taibaiella lutea]KAA5532367.1 hypothetical protein F0919_16375 [Taibaiella lutea]
MKNILIPTDFTIKSLKLINAAVEQFKGEPLKIYLIHALEPDSSISGLLFFKKRSKANFMYSDSFLDACEMLRNKYCSALKGIHIEFYFGQTNSYKKNFLEARKIDAIMLPLNYKFERCSGDSRDPFEVWRQKFVPVQYHSLSELPMPKSILSESKASLLSI